jgi:hypothetical protein
MLLGICGVLRRCGCDANLHCYSCHAKSHCRGAEGHRVALIAQVSLRLLDFCDAYKKLNDMTLPSPR